MRKRENSEHHQTSVAGVPDDVWVADFKSDSEVAVVQRSVDPSRVWLSFRSESLLLRISLEEGAARALNAQLSTRLTTFAERRGELARFRSKPLSVRRQGEAG